MIHCENCGGGIGFHMSECPPCTRIAALEAENAKLREQRDRLIEIEETVFHAISDAQCAACEAGDDEGTTAYQDAATIVNESFKDILAEIAQNNT